MDIETAQIIKGLASRDPYDQYFAMLSIEEEGRTDLLPRVLPLCQSLFADIRTMAFLTIGNLGSRESQFYAKALLPLLNDVDAAMRYEAAEALGSLGSICALADLRRAALEDPDRRVRVQAAKSARLIKGELLPEDEQREIRLILFDPYHQNAAA
jgi:HEAT repeat protein